MIGSPQPLSTLEQKIPSLHPRIKSAIKIQRVVLPCEKQFIKKPPVFSPQGICNVRSFYACGFIFLLHNILVE